MATIESGAADNAQIWGGQERSCSGKITKKHLVAGAALAGCVVLGLGLFVGLSGKSSGDSAGGNEIVGQAVEDPNSLGCFVDIRHNRVFTNRLTDEALTPTICNAHCEADGYAYYALQWGKECWCAGAHVDIDVNGVGECDYTCAGDSNYICGGYLSYTAYEVGTLAADAVAPADCGEGTLSVRFASSSGIAYFEGGGCATLTDMYVTQKGEGPLWVLDEDDNVIDGGGGTPTGRWLLTMELMIVDGVLLSMHGTSIGGDCDVLRIQSDGGEDFHEIRGHGGSLSFRNTKVTSWDTKNMVEQTDYEGGRSFINCVSEVQAGDDCEGAAKNDMGECRMDIIDSTMGNLGWFDAESYGLTWKVRGFCNDQSNPEVFDRTNVYGDIQGSDIYGMYYGMYSYGHSGGVWTNNKMHDNILYGFDPHDDSDDLTIADNVVYGNGNHGIIASKRCNNVEIYDNEVYDGGESAAGIFLHRSTDSAKVYNNYVHDMQDAGIAILESFDAEIYDNTFENVKYGIRISLGGADNHIHDNVFDTCSSYGLYTYMGSDEPEASDDGRPSENVFADNVISNTPTGVKLKEGDNNVFTGNDFTGAEVLEFEDSSNIEWTGNTIGDACADGDVDLASGSDSIKSC